MAERILLVTGSRALNDTAEAVRLDALRSLGRIADPAAVKVIETLAAIFCPEKPPRKKKS